MSAAIEPHPISPLAGVLSYLIPGLGQIYQGRVGKGLLFLVSLLGMFHIGEAMGGWQNVYLPPPENGGRFGQQRADAQGRGPSGVLLRWHFAGQFWIGIAAWPALLHYFGGPIPDAELHPFWHNYQKPPVETTLNDTLVNSDKTPDLGVMYTVIAGILNILVIYDAYAGPAFPRSPSPKPSPKPEEQLA